MSPRSEDYLRGAQRWLREAKLILDAGGYDTAVNSAYYAMLYAARAALSEEDRYARTHRGTWSLFAETFVATGRVPAELHRAAAAWQRPREDVSYDAREATAAEAADAVATAERFVAAIGALIA